MYQVKYSTSSQTSCSSWWHPQHTPCTTPILLSKVSSLHMYYIPRCNAFISNSPWTRLQKEHTSCSYGHTIFSKQACCPQGWWLNGIAPVWYSKVLDKPINGEEVKALPCSLSLGLTWGYCQQLVSQVCCCVSKQTCSHYQVDRRFLLQCTTRAISAILWQGAHRTCLYHH
jgi:hypothetical protein